MLRLNLFEKEVECLIESQLIGCSGFLRTVDPVSCPSSRRSAIPGLCILSSVEVIAVLRPSPSARLHDGPGRRQTRARV